MADITEFPIPRIEGLKTRDEYVALFRERCIALSRGQLTDFSDSSVLQVLAEAQAELFDQFVAEFWAKAYPDIVASSWELLGFERRRGSKAVGTARYLLDSVYAEPIFIPKFSRFEVQGVVFQTMDDLSIDAGIDTSIPANYQFASIPIEAVEEGGRGNLAAPQKARILVDVPGVSEIWLQEETRTGADEETPVQMRNRAAADILAAIGGTKRPVGNIQEFEAESERVLGPGSVAIAIPERDLNGNPQIGAMAIYLISPNGQPPTEGEKAKVQADIAPRSPFTAGGGLYVTGAVIDQLNIQIEITPQPTADIEALSMEINQKVRGMFNPLTTSEGGQLDIFQLSTLIYNTGQVKSGEFYWGLNGDQLLANRLTPGPLNKGANHPRPVRVNHLKIDYPSVGVSKEFVQ